MSTNSDFYDAVMQITGREGDTVSRAYAVTSCARILQNLDNNPFHPWFLEYEAALSVTAEVNTVDLPSDFLDFLEDGDVWWYPTSGDKEKVERGFLEEIQDVYANQDSAATPEAYDIVGDQLYLGPTPSAAGTLRFWYVRKTTAPADDTSNISNLWILNAEDYVAHLVAARVIRDKLRNLPYSREIQGEANTLRVELFRMNESRKHSNMDYEVNK